MNDSGPDNKGSGYKGLLYPDSDNQGVKMLS